MTPFQRVVSTATLFGARQYKKAGFADPENLLQGKSAIPGIGSFASLSIARSTAQSGRKESKKIKGRRTMARGGSRPGAGRPRGVKDRRTAVWREYLRQSVDWQRVVQALTKKATEGNVQASKLLMEYAYGSPGSMPGLEELEEARVRAGMEDPLSPSFSRWMQTGEEAEAFLSADNSTA